MRVALARRSLISYIETYTYDCNFDVVTTKMFDYYFCNTTGETFILSEIYYTFFMMFWLIVLAIFRSMTYQKHVEDKLQF